MDSLSTIPQPVPGYEPPVSVTVPPEVERALGNLALAVNHTLEPEQLRVYAYALRGVAVPLLRRACAALASESRFYPKPVEIIERAQQLGRADADAQARTRLLPPPAFRANEPTYFCTACFDEPNGWQIVWCPGAGEDRRVDPTARAYSTRIAPCGFVKDHAPHTYADRCPCLETNPVIKRAKDRAERVKARRAS